jgi:endonuclease/exonuclease/phosphatase family metal-dependent hydrolase
LDQDNQSAPPPTKEQQKDDKRKEEEKMKKSKAKFTARATATKMHNKKKGVPHNGVSGSETGSVWVHLRLVEGHKILPMDVMGKSDPYAKISLIHLDSKKPLPSSKQALSHVVLQSLTPIWNEEFTFRVREEDIEHGGLLVQVFDYDKLKSDDFIGLCVVPLKDVRGHTLPYTHSLGDRKFNKEHVAGVCSVLCVWCMCVEVVMYRVYTTSFIHHHTHTHVYIGAISVICAVQEDQDEAVKILDAAQLATRSGLLDEVSRKVEVNRNDVSLFVGTWNVGNAPPPDDLSPWIEVNKHDIYVIGGQEAQYKEREGFSSCAEDWMHQLTSHFGDGYSLLVQSTLLEIRTTVFVRNELVPFITRKDKSTEATGIGGVYGNKGGAVVSFCVYDTELCFVNCHLAAHQHKTSDRNDNVKEIINGVSLGHETRVDIMAQFHHLFWMGDLNYRLDFGDQGDEKTPSEEQFNTMVAMINNGNLFELWATDQLRSAIDRGDVFYKWNEGNVDLRPTFKVLRDTPAISYTAQRSPAWCDRILWRSLSTDNGQDMKQTSYASHEDILTSDHKPVSATFQLQCISYLPAVLTANEDMESVIEFDRLSCDLTGTKEQRKGGMLNCDPYVTFLGHFVQGKYSTSVKNKTFEPQWACDEIPRVLLGASNVARLRQEMLILRIKDSDVGKNSRLGSAVISLKDCLDEKSTGEGEDYAEFTADVLRGGLPIGTISGALKFSTISASAFALGASKPRSISISEQDSVTVEEVKVQLE